MWHLKDLKPRSLIHLHEDLVSVACKGVRDASFVSVASKGVRGIGGPRGGGVRDDPHWRDVEGMLSIAVIVNFPARIIS